MALIRPDFFQVSNKAWFVVILRWVRETEKLKCSKFSERHHNASYCFLSGWLQGGRVVVVVVVVVPEFFPPEQRFSLRP